MKIVLQTPTQLVIHEGVVGTVLLGTIFASAGGGIIMAWRWNPSGWSGNGGPWLVYLVGSVFIIVGILLLAMSADRRFDFDGVTRMVRLTVRRLVHSTSETLPFDTLKDVALEHSTSGARGPNQYYRVVFLTRSGGRVAWTPYSTPEEGTQATCAAAARAFCGWSGGEALAPAQITSSGTLSGHPAANNWGCAGALLAIFAAVGFGIFAAQVYRLRTWQPVSAEVLSTAIKSVRGSKGGVSYAPVVRYRYTVGGQQYESTRVLPLEISAGRPWAEELRGRFARKQTVTAYVDPARASDAFLVREMSFLPLLFVAVPLAMGAVFFWMVRYQRRQILTVAMHPVPIVEA